jgi:hypothetical protein
LDERINEPERACPTCQQRFIPASQKECGRCEKDSKAAAFEERATEIVRFACDHLAEMSDVLAYCVVAVTKDHHTSMRLCAPQHGAEKEDADQAISEVYEALFYLFSHEMKTSEGLARVHRMFEILHAKGAEERRKQKKLLDDEYASLASSVRWMGQCEGAAAKEKGESPPEPISVAEQTWNWVLGEVGFDVRGTPYEERLRAVHSDSWMKGFRDGFPGDSGKKEGSDPAP